MSESMLAREEAAARKAETTIKEQSATIALLREALEPFAAFAERWDAKPLSGIADEIYVIHAGLPDNEAALKLSDCRKAKQALSALPEQAGVSDRERDEERAAIQWLWRQFVQWAPKNAYCPDEHKNPIQRAVDYMKADGAALGAAEGEK